MDEIQIRCRAQRCPQVVSGWLQESTIQDLRSIARRHGWLTVIADDFVWDFCPKHGMTDWRNE